jgi:peptidoglycan/xylan/chitin deacetylase (PgdA/CDA1 family)
VRVCLTFDVDAVSLWTATFRSVSPSEISRGEFGATCAVPRVLALLAEKEVSATFFVPAITARQFPDVIKAVGDAGHEIGAHGDLHERTVNLTREEEADVHARSVETLEDLVGRRPLGYRSPGWELSSHTIELIEEHGFAYDSSQMATDFAPYRARRGDRVEDGDWIPGVESGIWEVPPAWELDDFPPFFTRPPAFVGGWTVAQVEEAWGEEFEYAVGLADAVFTLTMHPEVIGRGPRLRMLGRLIERMREHPDARFLRMGEVAEELEATQPRKG